MEGSVGLADMIGQLQRELRRAMSDGEDLRFEAERLELELTVGVERSREPGPTIRVRAQG